VTSGETEAPETAETAGGTEAWIDGRRTIATPVTGISEICRSEILETSLEGISLGEMIAVETDSMTDVVVVAVGEGEVAVGVAGEAVAVVAAVQTQMYSRLSSSFSLVRLRKALSNLCGGILTTKVPSKAPSQRRA
jgi:hypothetical protein